MIYQAQALSELQMMEVAPSIFAYKPAVHLSQNYQQVPTIEVVRGLQESGYYPVKVRQTQVRDPEGKEFAKHMIRLRKEGINQVGDIIPEIILVNSHNGTTSYQLKGGFYRLVCSNGLVVGNDMFDCRLRHNKDIVGKLTTEAGRLIDLIPQAIETAKKWASMTLSENQRIEFASQAKELRWDDPEDQKLIDAKALLRVRRYADSAPTLWNTFNVVQENLIKGGMRYRRNGRNSSTREVTAVDANIKLNSGLWQLTEVMALSMGA